MRTVRLARDFHYRPYRVGPVVIEYIGGAVYRRVPETAVRAILDAGAGEVIDDERPELRTATGDVHRAEK